MTKQRLLKGMFVALAVMLFVQLLVPAAMQSAVAAEEQLDLKLEVESAILIDAETGQVLYEKNADVARPPASMAKMMTEYLVLDAIKNGKFGWDDIVTTSDYAASIIGSRVFLASGEKLTVREMFISMSIASANDASVALAEFVAGTEENFAKMMNEKGKEMGLSDQARFINATGLGREDMGKGNAPASIEGETMLTAKDAAILGHRLMKDHPEMLEFSSMTFYQLRERDKSPLVNLNWMLENYKDNKNFAKYMFEGLDGLKTGHTNEAGYCFTGTAERNGMRLVSVVMGTSSEPMRFMETHKLMTYGFNQFERKEIVAADSAVDDLATVQLKKGVKKKVGVVTGEALTLVVRKDEKEDAFVKTSTAVDAKNLVAPIKKGQGVGTMQVKYNDAEYTVKLVAADDVDKGSWLRLFFRSIGDFFKGLFNGIKGLF